MSSTEKEFFEGKREWSRIKDNVLTKYLSAYLPKLNTINKPIILVDSFAGPGYFEQNKEEGSPLIFKRLAEKFVPEKYLAIFVNNNKKHHNTLSKVLEPQIKLQKIFTIKGDANDLLKQLKHLIDDQILFIYLDPFGLKGTDFTTLSDYLRRDLRFSTEILINLSVDSIIRHSCYKKLKTSGLTPEIERRHAINTQALGGDYWKLILDEKLTTPQRREILIKEYVKKIKSFLPYVGYCPVPEGYGKRKLIYIILFASRHKDARKLMNNIMFDEYRKFLWKGYSNGTLFEETSYEDNLQDNYFSALENDIKTALNSLGRIKKYRLWEYFLSYKFMYYKSKHFNQKIKDLVKAGIVEFDPTSSSKKLNDNSILYLVKK
jgi:three-Cys-motif partner protein